MNTEELSEQEPDKYNIFQGASTSKDSFIHGILLLCASFATIIVFFIIFFLFQSAGNFFQEVSLKEFLTGDKWYPWEDPKDPNKGGYGAYNIIAGTLLVTGGAMIIAIPLGIGTAIFIAEIAPRRLAKIMKVTVELLAGVPSVVFGFFGIVVLNKFVHDDLGASQGATWFSGSVILAIMALPTIITVAEDALRAVPKEIREGSLAVGATKWQTIRHVIIPTAISGIAAAIILGLGRAIGETIAVMMVTGNVNNFPNPITDVFKPIKTITGTIAIEMMEAESDSLHLKALFALAVVLFIMTFIINTMANVIISRYKKKTRGRTSEKVRKTTLPSFISENKDVIKFFIIIYLFGLIISYVTNLMNAILLCLIPIVGVVLLKIFLNEKFDELKFLIYYYIFGVLIFWLLSAWFKFINGLLLTIAFIGFLFILKLLNPKNQQRVIFILLTLGTLIVVYALASIIWYITERGLPLISWQFLTEYPKNGGREGGIFPAIVGSLYLMGGSLFYAMPIGIAAGIYLSEYAKDNRFTKIIRSGIDNLNATPSIVFGLFGFAVFILVLGFQVSMFVGQIVLALMILPTIIRTTEESLKSIPSEFREGSLALGSTKWQAIKKAVIPAATPGIMTGIILGTGRAGGETAPIMFTAVVFKQRRLPRFVIQPVMALTYHLFILATVMPDAEEQAAATALVLLGLVLFLYSIAIIIRNRFEKKRKW